MAVWRGILEIGPKLTIMAEPVSKQTRVFRFGNHAPVQLASNLSAPDPLFTRRQPRKRGLETGRQKQGEQPRKKRLRSENN
jgi:hypothetical protein